MLVQLHTARRAGPVADAVGERHERLLIRRGTAACRRRALRGYTTVELIVVMALTAILAAIAVPRLMDRSALQERGAADQLRGMLRHTRQIATTQQRDVCVIAAPAQARAVYCVGGAALTQPGGDPYVVDMPPGINLSGTPLVRFNARGQPVPALDQTLTVGATTLTVSRETGLAF